MPWWRQCELMRLLCLCVITLKLHGARATRRERASVCSSDSSTDSQLVIAPLAVSFFYWSSMGVGGWDISVCD